MVEGYSSNIEVFNNVVISLGQCNCFTNLKEVQLSEARLENEYPFRSQV